MRILAVIICALVMTGCSVATQKIDEITGTTKAQRCADRQAFLAAYDGLKNPSKEEHQLARAYRLYVAANCTGVK